ADALAGGADPAPWRPVAPGHVVYLGTARVRRLGGPGGRTGALAGRRRWRAFTGGRTHRPWPRRRFPLRHRARVRRPDPARTRRPALLRQPPLRTRLHRLGGAEPDRGAGRTGAAP